MIILVLTAVPLGLRGDLTKWLMELKAGVFAGRVSRRVREHLWIRVRRSATTVGSVLMIVTDRSQEQGFTVLSAGTDRWTPEDFDGLILMTRPLTQTTGGARRQEAEGE